MHLRCGFSAYCGILTLATACSGEPDAPTCGDGVRDPNEACDDGNRDSGDACTAACQLPGTLLECTPLLPEGEHGDEINALLPLPDLSFLAAGARSTKGRRVGWIGRYDDPGAQIWRTWPTPADEDGSSSIIDVAADSSEGYWALLARDVHEDLIHFDASGHVDARLYLPNIVQPAGFEVSATRLLVVDHHVWLAGQGGGGPDFWIGRFDIDTQTLDTILTEDYAGFYDNIWAIASSESEVAVAATVDTSPSNDGDEFLVPHSNVLLIRFDLQGQEVGRHVLGAADPGIATMANSIVADGNDAWVVGGDQHLLDDLLPGRQKAWMVGVQPSEGWTWTWTSAGPPAGGLRVNDILVSDREVVAVGWGYGEGQGYWSVGLGLDGKLHWERNLGEPNFLDAELTTVISDAAGRLRTTSKAWDSDPSGTSFLQSCLIAW